MLRCNVCSKTVNGNAEQASVRSNVRKFASEQFRLWRCPECKSIHAADEVDLAHYYRSYPFHNLGEQTVDWMLKAMYKNQLARLKAAGLRPEHSVLDFGCGGGAFVQFLQSRGYQDVHGFDEYSDKYGDRRVLERRYDLVLTQDVLEHVAEPWQLLDQLNGLLQPGGAVLIGTPNAEAIDLQDPEARVHTLHQPYHRHIFSRRALLTLGERLPWKLEQYYPTMYSNTFVPFVNSRFVTHYFRACDDMLDLAVEPIRANTLRLYALDTLFWALFGGFFAPETDVMVVYRQAA
ncbi:MAG TPA: class I SAM-dependent methyltransferase [Polyangiales bacterium]|nr:class I SAM-dependent methyltransferase [Polyangiales bacterium]